MGIKMSKAYHSILKREITIEEAVKKNIRDELFCTNKFCRIPLTMVGPHKRMSSIVRAHFKRKGKLEHSIDCDYNTFGQLNIAARNSEGALTSIENKKFKLRLNLITEALNNSGFKTNQEKITSNSKNRNIPSKNYVPSGEISAYLSTMKRIMQIKSKIENENELRNLIEIQFGNKSIRWTDFYFEFENYGKCFNKVHTKKINYPVCIEGEIKEFTKKVTEKGEFHFINLKLLRLNQNTKRYVAVHILIVNGQLFEILKKEFEKGKKHVAFCSVLKTNIISSTSEFLNITGKVYDMKQIFLY